MYETRTYQYKRSTRRLAELCNRLDEYTVNRAHYNSAVVYHIIRKVCVRVYVGQIGLRRLLLNARRYRSGYGLPSGKRKTSNLLTEKVRAV